MKKSSIGSQLILVVMLATGVVLSAKAQNRQPQFQQPPQPASAPASTKVLVSPEEDYRIGPSDVLEIVIEDAPELSGTYRVSASGTFPMHQLGSVSVAGKTAEELQKLIADGLRGDYLKDPRVTVIVKQMNSRAFFIQGAVRRPDVYQIEGKPSLLELVTLAGGLAENHGSTAFIIRKMKPKHVAITSESNAQSGEQSPEQDSPSTPKYDLLKVNINGLLRGDFDQNMFVEPGDIVNIPPTDVFFVAGEVNGPGSFPLKEGTTLRQAISLAQGTTFEAAKSRAVIFREDQTGKRQEIQIDLNAVMSGKKEDVPIAANDVIIVPNSRFKSVGGALLRAFGVNSARVPYRYY
jgi:polysaccharide export outer membrane protein